MNKQIRQRTTDKIVTKDIFSVTSSQGRNTFFLNENFDPSTANSGSKQKAAHLLGRPKFVGARSVQLIAGPTFPNTLETLLPTERIDAMAATAINEAISVYSIAVAPWVFFIRRRKKDSIDLCFTKRGPAL